MSANKYPLSLESAEALLDVVHAQVGFLVFWDAEVKFRTERCDKASEALAVFDHAERIVTTPADIMAMVKEEAVLTKAKLEASEALAEAIKAKGEVRTKLWEALDGLPYATWMVKVDGQTLMVDPYEKSVSIMDQPAIGEPVVEVQ